MVFSDLGTNFYDMANVKRLLVGGVAQWLGCLSVAGGLSLI